jgi:hypothetical protein
MKRWALIWLLAIAAGAAPAATAQSSSSSLIAFGSLDGHQPVSTTIIPAATSGQLTVSFHGDPATGCVAQGICGYSGSVVFRPGAQNDIALAKYRIHGRDDYQVQLEVQSAPGATFTGAQVSRVGGSVCSDAAAPSAELTGSITGDQVAISLIQPGGGLLSTRCAGPLDADLAGVGPQIRLTLAQLRAGRRTLPLSGGWSFAAGGFAGTIESNLSMGLGRPSIETLAGSHPPKVLQKDREVIENLALVRGAGNVSLGFGGDAGACQFLDSCGVQGTLDGTLAPQGGTASLVVLGPAKRPYADFLAALGLSRRGNPRGLAVEGSLGWPGGGTATERLDQGAACTSSAPLPGGVVILNPSPRGLSATYVLTGSPRTRCPGPQLAQFQTLASGSLTRAALGRPTFTLHLSGAGPLADDGYAIREQASVTLTLKRGRVHQQSLRVSGG